MITYVSQKYPPTFHDFPARESNFESHFLSLQLGLILRAAGELLSISHCVASLSPGVFRAALTDSESQFEVSRAAKEHKTFHWCSHKLRVNPCTS